MKRQTEADAHVSPRCKTENTDPELNEITKLRNQERTKKKITHENTPCIMLQVKFMSMKPHTHCYSLLMFVDVCEIFQKEKKGSDTSLSLHKAAL